MKRLSAVPTEDGETKAVGHLKHPIYFQSSQPFILSPVIWPRFYMKKLSTGAQNLSAMTPLKIPACHRCTVSVLAEQYLTVKKIKRNQENCQPGFNTKPAMQSQVGYQPNFLSPLHIYKTGVTIILFKDWMIWKSSMDLYDLSLTDIPIQVEGLFNLDLPSSWTPAMHTSKEQKRWQCLGCRPRVTIRDNHSHT